MPTPQELEEKFWKALKSDRTVMLGTSAEGAHLRPMTAMTDKETGNDIWFFTAKDTSIFKESAEGEASLMALASKGHDLFASVEGVLEPHFDRAVIDRLWNPFIAAWYEGKDDPKLALLRFRPAHAEVWQNGSSIAAGIKILLGRDPKKDYKDNAAEIDLR